MKENILKIFQRNHTILKKCFNDYIKYDTGLNFTLCKLLHFMRNVKLIGHSLPFYKACKD